jgi:acetyl-CoA C-acetyltransferase
VRVASNTPVIVGVAALQQREEAGGSGLEPIALMIESLRRAEADAGVAGLLRRADRIEVPKSLWSYSDPGRLVADALGCEAAQTVLGDFGIMQQTLLNRACASIAGGEASVVLVTGGEARYRQLQAKKAGVEAPETSQGDARPDVLLTPDAELWSSVESDAGLGMPVGYYAILDSALRYSQGLSVAQHRDQMAQIYAGFSQIAAGNPDAWAREPVEAGFIRDPSPRNRMLAFPYTKLHNSQWNVDQAAGLVFCSAGLAEEMGVPREQWVFPLATAESNAMSVVSARKELHRSYGFELAGRKVLELAGKSVDDLKLVELYSCFPQAVRVQLQELGLSAERALSVTGGMTFGGGPLNNFVFQATVKMAQLLRRQPGETGLVTTISGMNTKQACALYSTAAADAGWQFADVTAQVRGATQLCELVADYRGPAVVAGFTVLFQGDDPWRAVATCDLPDGRRTVAYSEQAALLKAMQEEEYCGRSVFVEQGQFKPA